MNDFVLLALLAGSPLVAWTCITISRLVEELHELKKRVVELESEQADEQPDDFRRKIWSMGATKIEAEGDLWDIGVNSPTKVTF
jgi:hypothetical protein